MTIKEVRGRGGRTRYRFVVDAASGRGGKRKQITKTCDSREEAEHQLATYRVARDKWRDPDGGVLLTDLFRAGECHPKCVFAWGSEEEGCECACDGAFHGRLSELSCDWAYLRVAPVRARTASRRAMPITRDQLLRVLDLRAQALSHPLDRRRPAAYIRERLAAQGVTATTDQINNWIAYARRNGILPAQTAEQRMPAATLEASTDGRAT